MNIRLHIEQTNNIWTRASKFIMESLTTHQNEKVLLLLSGGSAVKLYGELVREIRDDGGDGGKLAIGQVDERFKPENKEDINTVAIGKTGLWEICREKNIPYYLIPQEGTLEEATRKYHQTILKLFKEYQFKIAILGIGADGHTAGILPGYEKIWNLDKYVAGYDLGQNGPRGPFCPGGFPFRISLTPKALQMLDQAIVVANGEGKRNAVEVAENSKNIENLNKYPAALLQKIKRVDLFTDIFGLDDFSKRNKIVKQ